MSAPVAAKNRSAETEADEIEVGNRVFFRLRFSRRGPVAVFVHLKASDWSKTGAEIAEMELEAEAESTS